MSKTGLFRKGEALGTSTKAACPDLGLLVGLDGDLNKEEELVQRAGDGCWVESEARRQEQGIEALSAADPKGLVSSGEVHGKN